MRSVNAFICLALCVPRYSLPRNFCQLSAQRSYVVILKDGASVDAISEPIPGSNITHRWSIVDGFIATLTDGDLNKLRARRDVLSISENAVVRTAAKQ